MKKKLLVVLLILISVFLSGCDGFPWTFTYPPASTTTTTLPVPVNGTITVLNADYLTYPFYASDTYAITDVEAYNDVLLATRDHIRHANVHIVSTMYQTVWPGYQTIIANTSAGSGVIFKEDGDYYYAVTNFHVIDPGNDTAAYEINLVGEEVSSPATLVCYDESLDLAVIRFEKSGHEDVELMDFTTRLYKRMTVGELVFAVGNPLGLENNVTFGEFHSFTTSEFVDFYIIYHTAAINNGSSGGALTDVDGHLLGINTWGSESDDELSFAIPVYIVYMFLVNNSQV